MNTAPGLTFPGLGDCDACIHDQDAADRRAATVAKAYQETIVESGVKAEWDKREAGKSDE